MQKATKSYVVDIFDYYAPNYDEHMVGTLEFKTPFLIHSAVREVLESSNDDSVRTKKYERDRNDNFRPWLWYRTLWESICVPEAYADWG